MQPYYHTYPFYFAMSDKNTLDITISQCYTLYRSAMYRSIEWGMK